MAIVIPQRKPKPGSAGGSQVLGLLGGLAGAGIGFATGGPGGALLGAGKGFLTGAGAGQTVGGLLAPGKAAQQAPQPTAIQSSPIQNRLAQIEGDDATKLAQARVALTELPKDIQQQLQKPLDDAYALVLEERRKAGVA